MKISETWKVILVILFSIALAWSIISCQVKSDRDHISQWLIARSETVKDVDSRVVSIGPYWYIKGYRYYRVETDKGIYWFQFGWTDRIKKELSDGKYESIKD